MEFLGFENNSSNKEVDNQYNSKIIQPETSEYEFQGFEDSPLKGRDEVSFVGGNSGIGDSKFDKNILLEQTPDIQKIRAEKQPWYDQAASFLNRAVVGEIVGGTIMTAGAIVGIPELISNIVDKGEFDFSNKLFEVGKDISDWTQDVTPIYQTGERFADTGWWFQNGVSVASAASMLLPGMAVAKGVGLVGKALKLGVTATNMLSTGLGAVAMRHSENFREAHDVFKQAYDIAIQQNKSETEARTIAAESASLDYTANYANLVFDVIQLGSVLKPFAGLTRNIAPIAGKVASAADEAIGVAKYTPTTIKGKIFDRIVNPAKTGLAEWTEGIEEGINSISQLEAIRQAKIKSGSIKDDGSALPERIGKYLGEAEVQDAMLWGLIGGVAFKGLASATGFDESKGIAKNKIAELGERKQVIDYYSKVLKDLQAGTGEYKDQEKYPVAKRQELIQNVKDNFIQDLTFRAAEAGNVDILLAQIEDGNFVDKLVESGIGTKEEIKAQIPELVSKVKSYEDVYAKTYAKFYEQPMSSITKKILMNDSMDVELNIKKYTDRQQKLSKNINELLSKDTWYNAQENKSDIDIAIRQYSLGFAKLSLEYQLRNSPKNSDSSLLQKAIDKISKEIETASKTSKPIDIETIDNRVLQASVENTALEFYNGELLKHFEEISNPENIKNKAKVIDKAISKNKKTIADVIQNSSVTEAAKERKEAAAKVNGANPSPIDTNPEIVNEEDLNKDLTESVGEMFGEDVAAELGKGKTDTKLTDEISDEEYNDFVDNGKVADSRLEEIANKIEVSEKEKDLADIDSAINSQVSDGEAISVKEEDLGENDFESKKRLYGSAINYLTQAYNVTSGMMGKRTLDSSTADPIGLSASEWQNFKSGEEVELSLDTGFSGEVDLYDARGKRIRNSDGTIAKQFKTFEQIANEDLLDAPIKIETVRNGKKVVVGYFPSIKWLSATDWTSSQTFENLANTDKAPAQAEIDKVKAIRELISKAAADQVFKFKVDDTNLGNLNKSTDKSLAPVSKALPNLTKAPYFNKRGIKPFVIFNKGFRTSPDTLFEGNIALSEDYKKSVEAKGTGGLFMMIPSAKEGIFIPTPVSIPTVTPETAKALTTIIGDYKLNPESPSLTEAGKQTGINIKTNKALKDFLSGYVYISKQSPTGYNDSIPRIIFDTEKSEIILHKGREDKKNTVIQLNNLKNLTPQVLQSTLQELESFIAKNKITVKHSLLNSSDTLSIPQTIDGKITYKETTLQDYLADNIQTNLRELVTENGTPVYATQPVVYISPKEVLDAIKPAVEKIVNEVEPIVFDSPFDESLEGLPQQTIQEDSLISNDKNIKPGVSELFENNSILANEVYEALGFGKKLDNNKKLSIEELDKIIYNNNLRPELFPDLKSLHNNSARLKGFNIAPDKAAIYFLKNILIEANRNQSEIKTDIENIKDLIERAIVSIEKEDYNKATQLGEQALSKLHDDVSRFIINQIKENLITYPVAEINQITPQQKQEAQQLYSQYLEQNPNSTVEQFKSWLDNNQSDALISPEQRTEIIELSKDVLITDGTFVYSSQKQLAITKSIASVVFGEFIKADKEGSKLFVNKTFDIAKKGLQGRLDNFRKLYNLGEQAAMELIQKTPNMKFIGTYKNLEYLITEHERILKDNVWKQFENQVLINLNRLGISVKNNSISDMSFEEIEENKLEESIETDSTIEGNDGRFEKSLNELSTFQSDSKNTAGWRVKMELSKIRSGKINYLGIAEYLPFDTVFDDLQNILSLVEGDIDKYINELSETVKDNNPKWYLNDVIKLLNDPTTPWSTKNNFISVMQRAHNEFKLLVWKRDVKGWTLNIIDSNRNSVINKVLDTWNENFKAGKLVIKDPVKGMSIDKEAIKSLYSKFIEVNLEDMASIEGFLKNILFPELGIVLPESAMKELLSKNLEYIGGKSYNIRGNIKQQFRYTSDGTSSDGIISHIMESLRKDVVIPEEDDTDALTFNNPFVGENSEKAIKFLAKLSAKHGLKMDTNTFRNVESKMIYAYSFFIPEKLRINDLNSNQTLRDSLSNNPLTKFSTYLKLLNEGSKLEHNYMDGMVQSGRSASGITRQSMSYREQLLTAIAHFQSDLNTPSYVGLTHSDKTVTSVVKFKKHAFNLITSSDFNGVVTVDNLPNATIKEIRNLVLAEISRIQNFLEKKNTFITPNTHGEQYYKGAEYFYFFPKLNDLVRGEDGNIIPQNLNDIDALTNKALEDVVATINETVKEFQDKGIVTKFKDGDGKFTDNYSVAFKQSYIASILSKGNITQGFTESETKLLLAQAAADMDINYMIHNANMMMLVHGDPALFFKKDVTNTLIEYQKRLAKDAAPGALGHYKWKIGKYEGRRLYNVVIANDITHGTLTEGYISKLEAYTKKIDRTDAQEETTVEEHLMVLASYGRINDVMFIQMMDKIQKGKQDKTYYYEFDDDELAVILQPLKPVQIYYDDIANESNVNTMYYIKSSSFPLLPQLTKGTDLDKVRIAMERDDVQRLAFKTAVKTGHKKLATIANADGSIKDDLSFESNINQLDRGAFSIQQDVPYEKGKHRILTLSQMNKLLFEGLSDLEFDYNGKKVSGLELKKHKEAIRSKLFELSADELYNRLGIKIENGSPTITDYSKLVEAIKQEAISRNWGINDIDTLRFKDGNFVIPLGFNNSAARIEALVLSMFTNTIIKQKINGKSLVQGSSEGFRNNVKTLEELADTSGIVFIKNADTTKNFNPAKGLTTSTVIEEGNVVIRAQVLIPWKFAGKLKDFVKDGFLDLEKVDPELLHLIGARIPNQGHSSQIALQVVGFIPENMGDLILVPGEITRQMGADFDVDKLYTYIYNNILNDDGKLIIIPNLLDATGDLNKKKYFRFLRDNFSKTLEKNAQLKKFVDDQVTIGGLFKQILSGKEEKNSQFEDFLIELDSIKLFGMEELGFTKEELKKPSENFLYRASLENEYIRIHNIVLTHPEVVKKSTNPLDKEDLKITGKVGRKIDKGGNFLTFRRQLLDHLSQKAGKDGVGVFSRAVVGATVLQDYNLKLGYTNKEGDQVLTPFTRFGYLKDGKVVSFNLVKLSGTAKSYFDGLATEMRSKVDNIITQQSGSVDNAKEQVLADNNLNMTTFNVSIALSMLQEDGANGKALDITYNTYLLKQEIIYDFVNEITKLSDTLNEDYTPDKIEEVKYILTKKYLQRIGLPEYEVTGKAFTREDMKSLLETEDTSSISYVKDQLELLDSFLLLNSYGQELSEVFTAISVDSKGLGKSYWESNLKEIRLDNLGNKSLILNTGELLIDSEMGKLAQYVREANIILAELFPYASPHITNILGYLEGMSGRQDNINLEFRQAAWEAIKMYSYRNTNLDIYTNRKELFYGDNSLAKRIQKFKGTELGASNLFILKLRTVLATKVGNPDLVTFSASSAERTDESDVIKHFIDLFINEDPEVVQLAEDLVKYAFASGGIQKALEYIKYIPTSYLLTTNFGRVLSAINGSLYSESDFFDDYRFIEQFLQHNPQYARKYNSSSTPSKNRMVINSQEAANKYMMTIYKDGKLVSTVVPFITYRNVKTNEWWLYRLSETPKEEVDGESVGDFVYTRIGLLGGKGKDLTSYKEYEFDSEPTSLIPSNNVENAPVTITNTNPIESETPPVPVPSKENNLTKPNSQAKEMLVNEYFTNDIGKKALENLRETFTSSRFGTLLDYLINNSDYMSEGFSIKLNNKLTNHLGVPVRGIYKPDTNTIEINIKKIEQFLNKKGLTLNSDSIEQAIMHEVFHGFTSKLYNDWKMGKTLPANIVKALTQIEVLFNMANRALTDSSKADVALLKQAIAAGNMDLLPQDSTEDFINKFYGFTSPKEFIAEIFSNPEFQEIINNIESDKNFLQRFFEIIKKLFQGIKENSLLNESMNEVLSLIDVANKEFGLSNNTQQSTETINIYAGTNENAELSNFYIRPFELSKNLLDFLNKQGSDYSGINYKSVEQAFQNIKVSYNNTGFSDTLDKDILSTTDGGELRKLGRKINLDETKWNKDSSYIMKELMLESFKQNSDALAKLLDTGNATLTHKYKGVEQDKGRFSKLLMEVRDELRAQQSTTQDEVKGETSNEIYSKLGNKTKSENVVIKPWGELKDATRPITDKGIISTRIKTTDYNFGNIFSHQFAGNLIKTDSVKEAVERYINWVITGETGEYVFIGIQPEEIEEKRTWLLEKLKSGELKGKPILYYKELGEPSHATALDYLINKYDWNVNQPTEDSFSSQEEFDTPEGVFGSDELIAGKDNLGMSVGEFMKTLNAKEREYLRNMINNKEIKFKCR